MAHGRCLWEIYASVAAGIPITISIPTAQLAAFRTALTERPDAILAAVRSVDAERAEVSRLAAPPGTVPPRSAPPCRPALRRAAQSLCRAAPLCAAQPNPCAVQLATLRDIRPSYYLLSLLPHSALSPQTPRAADHKSCPCRIMFMYTIYTIYTDAPRPTPRAPRPTPHPTHPPRTPRRLSSQIGR